MIKAKQMGKTLRQEQTERTASKLGKKKPKYQAIIKVLKTQIEELQRQIQHQESEKDREIRRLHQVVSQQALTIKQLQALNSKASTKLKGCNQRLDQLGDFNKLTFTIGSLQRKGNSSAAKKHKEPHSVKMTDRTPRKQKDAQLQYMNHSVFSKSTMDMVLHASPLPHRFNLSSQMDEIPLVNVFNTEVKEREGSRMGKIICRSLKNEYRVHKCNSRCDSKDQEHR